MFERASHRDGEPLRSRWLQSYAVLVALTIWVLIFSGGLVTSKGVGLSVPDWPTSYGYNMFAFPISQWRGGILFEHFHRLLASTVGFMTIILTAWLWKRESRRWVCWLGTAALLTVVLQGVLGGLRVIWREADFGIFHACLAQAFLALVSFIALTTSGWWERLDRREVSLAERATIRRIGWMFAGVTVLIYTQLALGATMRHAHADLSIRDFPTAYGHLWPATDQASISAINQSREVLGMPATSAGLILLQMFHRLGAGAVAIGIVLVTAAVWRNWRLLDPRTRWIAACGLPLIALQISLGIYTIWTNKAADIATSHVAIGAASLVWGIVTMSALMRASRPAAAETRPDILPTLYWDKPRFAEVGAV